MRTKYLFLILFYGILNSSFGQTTDSIAPKKNSPVQWNIRAKALVGGLFEDQFAIAFSAGSELRFKKQFGIVFDVVHMHYTHEREVYKDGSYTDYDEYWQRDSRNYCVLELRYYPTFLSFSGWDMYLNGYSKLGKRFLHTHELYPIATSEIERLNGSLFDVGTSLGLSKQFNFLGFDVNLGAAYRNELRNEDYRLDDGTYLYVSDVRQARWIPNIRFSFYFSPFKQKNA